MIRRLIIHAGMPRAGSSTIQGALFHQRERLEKVGLLYAAVDVAPAGALDARPAYNHRELCVSGKGLWVAQRFHRLHDQIAAKIAASEAGAAVLSYEGWWDPRNHASLRRTIGVLRSKIPDLEVMIGGVVRDPASFMLSLYRLDVQHGRTMAPFEAYWPKKLREPRLRYADIGTAFEAMAGEARFINFADAAGDGRLVGTTLNVLGLGGVLQRAGLAHLERHKGPGSVYFSDAVISMTRFVATELGLARVAKSRRSLMLLLHQLSGRPDLRDSCDKLAIPMSSKAIAAIHAAVAPQARAFYRRHLDLDFPPPPVGQDDKQQSSIDRASFLGRSIMAEIERNSRNDMSN